MKGFITPSVPFAERRIIEMIIWLILFTIVIVDLILCSIYSRLRRKIDSSNIAKKITTQKTTVKSPNVNIKTKSINRSIKKAMIIFDRYMYGLCRYTSVLIGYVPGHWIRRTLLKYVLSMQLDSRCIIHGGCEIRSPWNIKIGNSVVGVGAILDGRNGIEIEDDVVLATGVWIWTEEHDAQDSYFRCLDKGGKVVIRKHAWIGNRVTILPKTVIDEGTVVAAGAVVTKSCNPFTMYGGVPAREIHGRNNDLKYTNVTKDVWPFY